MRWIIFLILAYMLTLIQTTIGRVVTIDLAIGTVSPDLLASLAVFAALYVRRKSDAVLAGCLLGFALDLTTAGGNSSVAVVGPMPLAYALCTWLMFEVREAFFRDRLLTRLLLTMVFCAIAHGVWVTAQSLLARDQTSWDEYGRMLGQVLGVAIYSAALSPLLLWAFVHCRKWLMVVPAGHSRHRRR